MEQPDVVENKFSEMGRISWIPMIDKLVNEQWSIRWFIGWRILGRTNIPYVFINS